MSPHTLSISALVAMFVIATVLPVNMGVLAFVGAFLAPLAARLLSAPTRPGCPFTSHARTSSMLSYVLSASTCRRQS
jgi:hypothetical protein